MWRLVLHYFADQHSNPSVAPTELEAKEELEGEGSVEHAADEAERDPRPPARRESEEGELSAQDFNLDEVEQAQFLEVYFLNREGQETWSKFAGIVPNLTSKFA